MAKGNIGRQGVPEDTYGHLFANRNSGLVDKLDTLAFEDLNATPAQPIEGSGQPDPVRPFLTPWNQGIKMVRPEGIEPPTPGSEVRCSIQLSYGRVSYIKHFDEVLSRMG